MRFNCPKCKKKVLADNATLGQAMECIHCSRKIKVPVILDRSEMSLFEEMTLKLVLKVAIIQNKFQSRINKVLFSKSASVLLLLSSFVVFVLSNVKA